MGLLATELRRFAWRRSFRVFGLITMVGIVTAAVIAFFTVETQPAAGVAGVGASNFDPRFHLTELIEIWEGTSIPLIILGLAFGASFIGAEWHSGTMTTLLTWEPRRVRVMAFKAGAAAIGVAIFVVLMQLFLGLALWPVAALRGTTEGIDVGWFLDASEVVARGALIAALFSSLGFGIASLARNTTTALVIGFVYFAVAESILRGLKPNWQPWLVGDNAAAFLIGRPDEVFSTSRSMTASLITVIVYCVGAVGIATAFFRARDVT